MSTSRILSTAGEGTVRMNRPPGRSRSKARSTTFGWSSGGTCSMTASIVTASKDPGSSGASAGNAPGRSR